MLNLAVYKKLMKYLVLFSPPFFMVAIINEITAFIYIYIYQSIFFVYLQNLNCLDNRKEWPLSVMLEVLKQLMEETPDNLLAKYVSYLKEIMLIYV